MAPRAYQSTNHPLTEAGFSDEDAHRAWQMLAPLLARCEYASEYAFGLEIIIDALGAQLTSHG
jgi:hypothetical protein